MKKQANNIKKQKVSQFLSLISLSHSFSALSISSFKSFLWVRKESRKREKVSVRLLIRNAAAPDADAAHDGSLLFQQRHNWSHSTGSLFSSLPLSFSFLACLLCAFYRLCSLFYCPWWMDSLKRFNFFSFMVKVVFIFVSVGFDCGLAFVVHAWCCWKLLSVTRWVVFIYLFCSSIILLSFYWDTAWVKWGFNPF